MLPISTLVIIEIQHFNFRSHSEQAQGFLDLISFHRQQAFHIVTDSQELVENTIGV